MLNINFVRVFQLQTKLSINLLFFTIGPGEFNQIRNAITHSL